jgi:hypothetical protein
MMIVKWSCLMMMVVNVWGMETRKLNTELVLSMQFVI